jgi:hypothetical protein
MLNEKTKQFLLNLKVYYPLAYLWNIPKIIKWIHNGAASRPPHLVKMVIILGYLKRFNLNRFVETGTFKGDTLDYIARTGIDCVSIELSEDLFFSVKQRFKNFKNVLLIRGDSGQKLLEILQTIDEPALFWLDGHQMVGGVRGGLITPISLELKAILEHRIKNHVILIDDARLFKGISDYPLLEDLLHTVHSHNMYAVEISSDIIRLVPKHMKQV